MVRVIVLVLIFIAVAFGPQLWVRRVFAQYSDPRDDYPGTAGELARHLLDRFDMKHVKVEATDMPMGDHYDPEAKAVRLTQDKIIGRSLTAVTVAAHEVGHAIQDHTGYQPLTERTRLARLAQRAQQTGAIVMMVGFPLVSLLSRSPVVGLLMVGVGVAIMGISTLVHLVTLPVEWDASFRRALPLLQQGSYLSPRDMTGARRILTAAALTYVAGSLASLLSLWYWVRFFRV